MSELREGDKVKYVHDNGHTPSTDVADVAPLWDGKHGKIVGTISGVVINAYGQPRYYVDFGHGSGFVIFQDGELERYIEPVNVSLDEGLFEI